LVGGCFASKHVGDLNPIDVWLAFREVERNGCEVLVAEDTRRFAAYLDLFVNMTEMQLTYDVLRVLDFNTDLLQRSIEGSRFLAELGRAGKIAQARFVARRR
jgi:sarcosine/dimethylglycine N-methyltransferase